MGFALLGGHPILVLYSLQNTTLLEHEHKLIILLVARNLAHMVSRH